MAEEVFISGNGVLTSHTGPIQGATIHGVVAGDQPLIFWLHDAAQMIPNATWTPLALNLRQNTVGTWNSFVAASTTVAAGSNAVPLPTGTINVASAASFASSGYVVIAISGSDRLVKYTGKGATTLTGCTLGVGTLATGQTVRQANVDWDMPDGMMGPATVEVAWASNATGIRGVRFKDLSGFGFNLGTDIRAAVAAADPLLRNQSTEQPAAGSGYRIEVYQSSTGDLATATDSLAAPRLVATAVSHIS